MDKQRTARVLINIAKSIISKEGDYSELNNKSVMLIMAKLVGFKLTPRPMLSTLGDSWDMSSNKDFLDLDIFFDKNGKKFSVNAFAQEEFQQEPLVGIDNVRLSGDLEADMKKLLRTMKKVIREAKADDLLGHLKMESAY